MNTIVCNTLLGAVSEYTRFEFNSITATHAGTAHGLFAFGGNTDNGQPITSHMRLPATLRDSTLKKLIKAAYLSMRGDGGALFTVYGPNGEQWDYPFAMRPTGQTRCLVGRGIRENYLGFGLSTPCGQDFTLDRLEIVELESKNRRI